MKCINCGKYPFCNKIEDSQQKACGSFVKRPLEIEAIRKEKITNERKK